MQVETLVNFAMLQRFLLKNTTASPGVVYGKDIPSTSHDVLRTE